MKRSLLTWISYGAVVGLIVAIVLMIVERVIDRTPQLYESFSDPLHVVMRVFWPLSVAFIAIPGWRGTVEDYWFAFVVVLTNVILYALVAAGAWAAARALRASLGPRL